MTPEEVLHRLAEILDERGHGDDQRGYQYGLHQRQLDYFGGPAVGRETLTVSNASTGLLAVPDFARQAFCTVTLAAIRVVFGSFALPTTTVGSHFGIGEHFIVTGVKALEEFRAIREAGVDAQLDVEYFG